MANLREEDYTALFADADAYNAELRTLAHPLLNFAEIVGYSDQLKIDSSCIIGSIVIEKINVRLPIRHGSSNAVLNNGVGHLEGTSLPVGGAGTHAVLTTHRGLPSAKLFTDLDKLDLRDTFQVNVLNRRLVYQIDQIQTVDPDQVEDLGLIDGKDYCSLFTCTPYGINTQRLLVRGIRLEMDDEGSNVYVSSDAYEIDTLTVMSVVFAAILIIALVVLLIRRRNA